jgi:hypothetical protein
MNERFKPGAETWYASDSPSSTFSIVFEDDGDTGYAYACDRSHGQLILDAIHVYDVHALADGNQESTLEVAWSGDGLKAGLLIDGRPHAIVDFVPRVICSRSNGPQPAEGWQHSPWDDAEWTAFVSTR